MPKECGGVDGVGEEGEGEVAASAKCDDGIGLTRPARRRLGRMVSWRRISRSSEPERKERMEGMSVVEERPFDVGGALVKAVNERRQPPPWRWNRRRWIDRPQPQACEVGSQPRLAPEEAIAQRLRYRVGGRVGTGAAQRRKECRSLAQGKEKASKDCGSVLAMGQAEIGEKG